MGATIAGPDGRSRCGWCGAAPEFLGYHDAEWGFPVSDDHRLFEKLSLEGFQSGLSWRTILAKRENFRAAFHGFDFHGIARCTQRHIDRLLKMGLSPSVLARSASKFAGVAAGTICADGKTKRKGGFRHGLAVVQRPGSARSRAPSGLTGERRAAAGLATRRPGLIKKIT